MADYNIGNLKATLQVENGQFKQGMKDSETSVKGLNSGMVNAAATLNVLQQGFQYTRKAIDLYVDAAMNGYAEIDMFNRMTGTSIEQGGKWKEVLERNGMSLNDLSYAFRTLSNNVQMAINDPKSGAAAAFKELGVSLTDINGNMKDSNQIMIDVITALQKVPDPMNRNALAADTLGKSYVDLNKLFTTNIDLNKQLAEAETPYDEESKEKVEKYKEAMAKLNSSIEDLEVNTGEKLIPMLTTLADLLNETVVPAINGALEGVQNLGKSFGLFLVSIVEMYGRANDILANSPIGSLLGLKPFDYATVDNLRSMIEGTFQGATKTKTESTKTGGGGSQPVTETAAKQSEVADAAAAQAAADKEARRVAGLSGEGTYTAPSEQNMAAAKALRERGIAIQKKIGELARGGASAASLLPLRSELEGIMQQYLYYTGSQTSTPTGSLTFGMDSMEFVRLKNQMDSMGEQGVNLRYLYTAVKNGNIGNITKYGALLGYSAQDISSLTPEIILEKITAWQSAYTEIARQYNEQATLARNPYFMAQGGIVTRPTMAVIGERGPEAVVPLGTGSNVGGDVRISIMLDSNVVGEALVSKLSLLGVPIRS